MDHSLLNYMNQTTWDQNLTFAKNGNKEKKAEWDSEGSEIHFH